MIDEKTLEEAKERALSEGALYITGKKDDKFNSPKDVIECLFKNGSSNTFYSNTDIKQFTGSSRSIHDMCRIIWHYFPEASIRECVKAIYASKFKIETYGGQRECIVALNGYCSDVHRLVHSLSLKSNEQNLEAIMRHMHNKYGSSLHKILYADLMRYCGIIE